MRSPPVGVSRLRSRLQSWFQDGTSRRNRQDRDVELIVRNLDALTSGRRPELMPERLDRLGLDPAYVRLFHASTYQDLQRVCASCEAWRLCARDLARGDVQSGMQSYCLNGLSIDALLVGWPPWEDMP